jgi:hypothetical protein
VVRHQLNYIKKFVLGESPYYDVKDPTSPCWGIMRGILYGGYEHVTEEVVVEKDRGWAADIPLLKNLTGENPCVLSPVRPIPEIIASFVLLSEKIGKRSKIEDELRLAGRESNLWSLTRVIWEKYIYASWRDFKLGFESNPECFLLLEYEGIVSNPKRTMNLITTYLDVSPWSPATSGLKNPNPENDKVYGMPGLHDVKSELKRTSPPAREVLGDECYEFWANKNLEFWQF